MTTVELANHLMPYVTFRDPAECQAWEAQELGLVMSQAVQEWFSLAPAHWRRTTLSRQQPAPETIAVEIANNSATAVGAPFTAAQRGCTIFIEGDPRPNEITGPSTLLYPFIGASGTALSATVYYDCVPFPDFLIERVVTHPEVITAMGQSLRLYPIDHGSRTIQVPRMGAAFTSFTEPSRRTDKAEHPTGYWLEPIGGSIQVAVDGVFQIRMWPLPTAEVLIQMDAEVLPIAYRIADVTTVATLPVPDSLCHRLLVPLARGILADSPIFDLKTRGSQISGLKTRQATAEKQIAELAGTWSASTQTFGTPDGW